MRERRESVTVFATVHHTWIRLCKVKSLLGCHQSLRRAHVSVVSLDLPTTHQLSNPGSASRYRCLCLAAAVFGRFVPNVLVGIHLLRSGC